MRSCIHFKWRVKTWNKFKYNLKNVHAAKPTETGVEGMHSYNYAAPKAISGTVSLLLVPDRDLSGDTG